MIHNSLSLPHYVSDPKNVTSAHWAVGKNENCILLQTDDGLEQARLKLTAEEALEIAIELIAISKDFTKPEVKAKICPPDEL